MKICNLELPDSGLVFVAGRPGMGKSYVILEMANELNQKGIKPVLLYADGRKSHSSCHYENGVVREYPSRLSCVKKVYPDIPYIVEDDATYHLLPRWETLMKNIIKFEHPKVILINDLVNPGKVVSGEISKLLHNIAKENEILIIAECQVSRKVEERKDGHPQINDVKCDREAIKYVDQVFFIYHDGCFAFDEGNEHKKIEVYSLGQRIFMPFNPQKYSV